MTFTFSFEAVLRSSLSREAGGRDCYYMSKHDDDGNAFIEDCAFWCERMDRAASKVNESFLLDDPGKEAIMVKSIRFASGFQIHAMSSNPSRLRSKRGHVYLDEFAFHPYAEQAFAAATAFIIWGGTITILSTHNGIHSKFNKMIGDTRSGKEDYSLHRTTFDQAIEQGLFEKVRDVSGQGFAFDSREAYSESIYKLSGDAAPQELQCVPTGDDSDSYFGIENIDKCMTLSFDDCPYIYHSMRKYDGDSDECEARYERLVSEHIDPALKQVVMFKSLFMGVDFGRVANLSSICLVGLLDNMKREMQFLIELECFPFYLQERLLIYITEKLIKTRQFERGGSDNAGLGRASTETLVRKFGNRWSPINPSSSYYDEVIPAFRDLLSGDKIAMVDCAPLRTDLSLIRRIKGVPRVPPDKELTTKTPDGKSRHCDSALSLMYTCSLVSHKKSYAKVPGRKAIMTGGRQMRASTGWR